MKRFLFAAFVGVALSLLAACGDDDATTAGGEENTTIAAGNGQQKLGSDLYTLQVSATEKGGEVSGSGSIANGDVEESFTVECSAEDGEIVMVGGTFDDGERAGERVAFLIKDLDPDRVSVWFEEQPPADDCDSMLEDIPADVTSNESFFLPLEEGDFSVGG